MLFNQVSGSSRGAITTSLRYSALAQRQCTGLLRQEIQVRVLGAELCTFVALGQARGHEGAETGLSDGFRALPCKQSHGSSTLHSSTEWADRQGLSPSDYHTDCGVIRFPSLLLPAFASVVQRTGPQSSKLVMWVRFPPLALGIGVHAALSGSLWRDDARRLAQVVEQEYTPASETGSGRTCRFDPGPEHADKQVTTTNMEGEVGVVPTLDC